MTTIGPIAGIAPVTKPGLPVGSLRPGQVVWVQRVSPVGGESRVAINGRLFSVDGQLDAGAKTFLGLIEVVNQDRVHLRRLTGKAQLELTDWDRVVRELGLRGGQITTRVVREVLRWGLPVESQQVKRLLTEIEQLDPEDQEQYLSPRVWLKTVDLEENQQVIQRVINCLVKGEDQQGEELVNSARTLMTGIPNLFACSLRPEGIPGELYLLSRRPKGSSWEDEVTAVLHLETANLGQFWVALDWRQGSLQVDLLGDNPDGVERLQRSQELLQLALEGSGIQVRGVRVAQQLVTAVVQLLVPEGAALYHPLDVRA